MVCRRIRGEQGAEPVIPSSIVNYQGDIQGIAAPMQGDICGNGNLRPFPGTAEAVRPDRRRDGERPVDT